MSQNPKVESPLHLSISSHRNASMFGIGPITNDEENSRWLFSRAYKKLDKNAWFENGKGSLQEECIVTVHDYGEVVNNNGKTITMYHINGVAAEENSSTRTTSAHFSSVEQLLKAFTEKFFQQRPSWCRVRWIDVDGMNGDIVQFLISLVGCERQYTFNNIVDLKQRPMGIVLDEDDDETNILKFLLVSKVPSLSPEAIQQQDADSETLYNLRSTVADEDKEVNIIDYEQITYLMRLDNAANTGTLISFQDGKLGDVFGEVRQAIQSKQAGNRFQSRGTSYLLLQLVRCSTESAVNIARFISKAITQLQTDMHKKPDSLELVNHARHINSECDLMHTMIVPFGETIAEICVSGANDSFPPEIMGKSRSAWHSINFQMKRLIENITAEKSRAESLVEQYRDEMSKRQESAQKRIETSQNIMSLVLSIFSPLAFISGVYGMNFTQPNGDPGIPELTWGWVAGSDPPVRNGLTGYGYFWILCVVVIVLTLIMYMYLGLLYNPVEHLYYTIKGQSNSISALKCAKRVKQQHAKEEEDKKDYRVQDGDQAEGDDNKFKEHPSAAV